MYLFFFFFKQKTAYEMRISDWSSDVCSSDLQGDETDQDRGDIEHGPSLARPSKPCKRLSARRCLHSLRRVAQGSCNANHPWFVPSPRCRIPPRDRGFEPGKDLFMRNLTKGLMGSFAAISVAATAPPYAGLPTIPPAQGHGLFTADQDAGFSRQQRHHRNYSDRKS